MKGLLLDTDTNVLRRTEVCELQDYYDEMHCNSIDTVFINVNGYRLAIICDDEALLLINGKVPIPAVILQDRNVVIYNSVIFATVQPDCDDFCDLPEDLALTIQHRLSHLDDEKLIVNL